MRPPLQAARDQLPSVLGRHPGISAPDLAAQLGVSVPTLHRLLQEQAAHIVSAGKARRTRYALRRPLRGDLHDLPLYEVSHEGRIEPIGTLSALHPQGSCLHLTLPDGHPTWPLPDEARDGWWDGLPYPLYDMRPQGYMGRQFARAEHRQLGVPAAPNEWGDDDILHVLRQRGHDLSGNLILGETACALWQQAHQDLPAPLDGAAIGPDVGSCGTAAFRRQLVISPDISRDPLWQGFRELALAHGLKACWSTPIIASGKVLGTFAFYYRTPRGPSAPERMLVEACVHLCAIAIAHSAAQRRTTRTRSGWTRSS